jgi:hypothetical protein
MSIRGRTGSPTEVRSPALAKLLRNPLCRFLIVGAVIYMGTMWLGDSGSGRYQVHVTAGHVASMAHAFEQTWLRPPTAEERAALIDDYVREEILYREAVAAGLHENDQIVRLRLRQQMELLTQDLVAAMEPTEQELAAWLEQHAGQFMSAPLITFEQTYLDADTISLPAGMEQASPRQIERVFGTEFAARLAGLEVAEWEGPVSSGFGKHLVRIRARVPPRLPRLEDIRDEVAAAWRAARTQELDDRYYAELISRYTVEVDAASRNP